MNQPDDDGKQGWFKGLFKHLFEIDVRSLAVFRILLGALVLFDLTNRFADLELLYTEKGILPLEMSRQFLGDGFWSLYWIDGSLLTTQLLFALTIVAAIGLLVGFNTRLMTILCLVLVASLQVRNPLVLTGGHILMRAMLFWSMFLPLGAVWSVDAYLRPYRDPERWKVASVATMAIMLQVAFLYFFSGIAKLNDYWFSGQAVEYVLSMQMYVKPLGDEIRQFPQVLRIISVFTVCLEIVGPILLFVPRVYKFFRGMVMALFWIMHIAIWLTMSIGVFSMMAMACWFVFVPGEFWNTYFRSRRGSLEDYDLDFTPFSLITQIICGAALVLVFVLNCANINPEKSVSWFPQSLRTLANQTLLVQEFKLFGHPPFSSPMFEYHAELADGTETDVFEEMMNRSGKRSKSIYQYFATQYWRRIHSNLMTDDDKPTPEIVIEIRERLLDRLVSRWNLSHPPEQYVINAKLTCNVRTIQLNNQWSEPREMTWAEWSND